MPTIVNGVEYAEVPGPSDLWRVTRYSYASDLIERGIVYLSNAQKYRDDPDPQRGDSTETDGRFIRQGVPCTTGHTNPIFLWCATLESNSECLFQLWRDCDTIVHVSNPQALAERMLKAAKAQAVAGVSFHAGMPSYDKNRGGTAPYTWAESIFQKPNEHAPQREYRFALVGSHAMAETPNVRLILGPCSDIVSIAEKRQSEQGAAEQPATAGESK